MGKNEKLSEEQKEKLELIRKISILFNKSKKDINILIKELNNISKEKIIKQFENFKKKKSIEKVVKIRLEILKILKEKDITLNEINSIKKNINNKYEKNILKNWGNFGILYSLYYYYYQEEIKIFFKELNDNIESKLNIKFNNNIVDLNGPQNNGSNNCWIALYEKKYKSQKEANQLFIRFENIITYGIYNYKEKKYLIPKQEVEYENFELNLIIHYFQNNLNYLKNTSNYLKNTSNYFENSNSNILKKKKQIILYGPPGTGKTYNTKNIIYNFITDENNLLKKNEKKEIDNNYKELEEQERVKFITFHQSFAYEEFIEGLKPIEGEKNSNLERDYKVENGIFKEICEKAISSIKKDLTLEEFYNLTKEERKELFEKEDEKNYYLIIDEINRGNISKIFGELITLLESDKRLGQENELITTLPYSKEKFGIPPNLYIIATMNTSDKSIATLDVALRRRFGFVEMPPISNLDEITTNCEEINLQELLKTINKRIEFLLDKDHLIGHSYFMNIKSIKELKEVFYNEIIPLLEEYFYGDYEKLQLVLGKKFVIKNNEFKESLFENNEIIDFEEIKYKINKFKIDEKLDNFKEAIENIIKPKENKKESNE